jgi:alpha-amylase/alpha-mannosidase (GH57 family)
MQEALAVFERVFGRRPRGCWPSEGAISEGALRVMQSAGLEWMASSGNVLQAALAKSGIEPEQHGGERLLHQAHCGPDGPMHCFFRDDGISDLIGFTYSRWHGDDAARHLIEQVERMADVTQGVPGRVLLVALDGENAWEHYPFNGYYFLDAMYASLSQSSRVRLTTLSDVIDDATAQGVQPHLLPHVRAGSWVHGTLSTWMGDPDKNAGWDLLCEAKLAYDQVLASGRLDAAQQQVASRQLAHCESSDWFWWFGDYNPPEAVRDFDLLFRHQLTSLYHLLGIDPPPALQHSLSAGGGTPESGGVMRRAQA